jgi:hypothetical protein
MAKKHHKPQQISPKNYIIAKGRTLPIINCYITIDWKELGIATVCIVRQMPSGKLLIGSYVVDIYCLGVKDTLFFFGIEPDNIYEEVLNRAYGGDNFEEIDANLAQNIVWGALEYAEDLGFTPHRDFEVTEYLLDPADKIEYVEVEFGKDGKPFYFSGPYDDTDKILNKLVNKLGVGGFNFILNEDAWEYDDWDDENDDDDDRDEDWDDEEDEDEADESSKTTNFGDYIDFEETK